MFFFFSLSCHFFKFNLWISGFIQPVWCFIQHITDLPHSWSCSSNDSFQSCSLFSCPIVFPYQHFHISFENHNVRTSWGLSGKGEMEVFSSSLTAHSQTTFSFVLNRPKTKESETCFAIEIDQCKQTAGRTGHCDDVTMHSSHPRICSDCWIHLMGSVVFALWSYHLMPNSLYCGFSISVRNVCSTMFQFLRMCFGNVLISHKTAILESNTQEWTVALKGHRCTLFTPKRYLKGVLLL